MSNSLYPDQVRRLFGPDLVPNCLQKLSADNISRQRVNEHVQVSNGTRPIKFRLNLSISMGAQAAGTIHGRLCEKCLLSNKTKLCESAGFSLSSIILLYKAFCTEYYN